MDARRRHLAAAALAGSLTASMLAACSGGDPTPPDGRGIDAASYYEDYESDEADRAYGSTRSYATGGAQSDGSADAEPEIPGPLEDDTFVDAGTSGFVDTGVDARSTFALDVDTGSWNVAQTLLAGGLLPPPESIRVEEWVNALPAALPRPEDTVGVTGESAAAPGLPERTELVRVGVATRPVRADDRRPVSVTLVVDRSGSMDIRDRLGLVQSSLALLADGLRDDDTVSVVSFEDRARPLLEPTPVSDTDAILSAIEELTPGGSTNLEAGLRLGYEQARESFREDATNIVVLASDGVANVGATGPGSIVDRIREEGADGIHLVTVGYGMGNYNDHLMEQLADLGDGFYAYVDDFDEAERLFRDELTTALVPVADDARVQVAFDPAVVTSYRLVGYDNRDLADAAFTDASADAGELGAGHHATALYEVQLADGVAPGTPLGTAAVRWTPVDGGPQREASVGLVASGGTPPTGALALESVVADLAHVLKQAAPYAERGVTLAALEERAAALEEGGVPGATTVLETVRLARRAA
ncbi:MULTISPECIES: vWA domain-containing protein [unclassified Nocardioides]|uniref:vWA domain-containing protein n=1 Tax=unclassified Nocardioides TaxID=2615069 RepID=UPI00360FF630